MTTLLWFRRDLRLDDHPALWRACADGPVIPVYCLPPESETGPLYSTGVSLARCGAHRHRFLLEALHDLRSALRACGSNLIVMNAPPEQALPQLASATGARRLVTTWQPGTEEAAQVEAVRLTMGPLPVDEVENDGLFRRAQLPFPLARLPGTFTGFRKRVEAHFDMDPPLLAPQRLPSIPAAARALDQGLPERPAADRDPRAALQLQGGERAGRARLRHYLWDSEAIRDYKQTRNGLLGADYSSKLSPWLALGCLSPRRVVSEVRRFEREVIANDSTYWLIFEVLWREYFRWVAGEAGARLFAFNGISERRLPEPPFNAERFQRWCEGRTGLPFVDANMRELNATGFMSNRGRQNVASFLIHDLAMDWRLGAAWFEQQLIDYDVASNWGNWAYIAGAGTDPRQGRWFNVLNQALRYDSRGDYVCHWIPELKTLEAGHRHTPFLLPAHRRTALGLPDLVIPPPSGWHEDLNTRPQRKA